MSVQKVTIPGPVSRYYFSTSYFTLSYLSLVYVAYKVHSAKATDQRDEVYLIIRATESRKGPFRAGRKGQGEGGIYYKITSSIHS